MADVELIAGQLPQPACNYANEQERLEAFVGAMEASTTSEGQWQSSQSAPEDIENTYWLKLDNDGRPIAALKWSVEDGDWVRWLGQVVFGLTEGAGNAYELTLDPPFLSSAAAYQAGRIYIVIADHDNADGGTTFAVDGFAAQAVTKKNDVALVEGDILEDQVLILMHTGSNFRLLNPNPPERATLKQFLVATPAQVGIPSSGSTVAIPHTLGAMPLNFWVRAIKTAVGTLTITYKDGSGTMSITQNQELELGMFWTGFRGDENESQVPVFRVWADEDNIYVSAFYPNGIAIFVEDINNLSVDPMEQVISEADFQLKAGAIIVNPDYVEP